MVIKEVGGYQQPEEILPICNPLRWPSDDCTLICRCPLNIRPVDRWSSTKQKNNKEIRERRARFVLDCGRTKRLLKIVSFFFFLEFLLCLEESHSTSESHNSVKKSVDPNDRRSVCFFCYRPKKIKLRYLFETKSSKRLFLLKVNLFSWRCHSWIPCQFS